MNKRIWLFIKWDIFIYWRRWLLAPLLRPVKWRLDMCYTWICDKHPKVAYTFGTGTGAMGELYNFVYDFAVVLLFKGYKRK